MFDVWHLGVPVQNLEETLQFYVTGLGFEFLGYYERTMAFVRPPGKAFTIEFMEFKSDAEGLEKKPHHLAFECENVEQFRQDLIKKGYFTHVQEITPSNNGMRLFAMIDPDGIKVQFYQGKAGFEKAIEHTIDQCASRRPAVALGKEQLA
jgi:catechol 2,3-dioxygenase-like lactoylglutathione lyase family enzyme